MSSGSHLSKELFDLVKSIGEAKSKQEEDKIVLNEINVLRGKISVPSIPDKRMKEYILRSLYIEMLGHDASFAHIHAINLTQSANTMSKRIGYMACGLTLAPDSQLLILLVAALQRDLQSSNYLEISGALSAISKLANSGIVHALNEQVLSLLSHSHELIRKKAVMVLHKFILLNPTGLSEYNEHFRRALCDKDPSVMGSTLNFFLTVLQEEKNRVYYKDLIASFVVILKQVIDHKLPRDFDYHRMPAPWFQIKLLEILSLLGRDDQRASEQMYEILSEVMRRADDIGINVGYAIVYQCLKTITSIYPNAGLIDTASHCISRFLTSENHNLKHTGITGLIQIVKINPKYSQDHQITVVDCLEDPDDTLKRNTLNLLYRMTNPGNVRVIVDKMKVFLKSTAFDSHLKAELMSRITELSEKYAPNSRWYLSTMNSVFQLAGEHVKPEIVNNLVRLIDEWRDDPQSIEFTLQQYLELLQDTEHVQDPLMQVAVWVLGEFGDSLGPEQQTQVMALLCKALHWRFESPTTKGWILTALLKLGNGVPSDEVRELVSKFSFSRNEDLQQRCYEFAGVCTKLAHPLSFKENLGMPLDQKLGFLDNFVQQQLLDGAQPYNPNKNRSELKFNTAKPLKGENTFEGLHFNPYQAPRKDSKPVLVSEQPVVPAADRLELNVKRLWDREKGYLGNLPAAEQPRSAQPPAQSATFQSSATFQPSTNNYQPRPVQKTQKELEKEQFARRLFGEMAPAEEPPARPQRKEPPQGGGSLLDF